MFLPDRFIKGECPKCGAKDQYGDSCEVCGATYAPTELKNAYSVVSGAAPERRASEHYFFRLSAPQCEQFLRDFTQGSNRLQPEAANKMKEWLGEPGDGKALGLGHLARRALLRLPHPGTDNKFFYVWLDAPVGYFGSFRNYVRSRTRWATTSPKRLPDARREGRRAPKWCISSARTSCTSTPCSGRPC
jgi:methionyl-tRNA synthetase